MSRPHLPHGFQRQPVLMTIVLLVFITGCSECLATCSAKHRQQARLLAVLGLLWVLSIALVTCMVCLVAKTPASLFWNLPDLSNTNSLNSSLVSRSSVLMSICMNWRGKFSLDRFHVLSQVRNALNRMVSSGHR